MSAFRPPWKDIDDTRPGTPYVVDSDGWGWFALFIVISIPFLAIAGVVVRFSALICAHPIASLLCYVALTLVLGGAFYARPTIRHRICGVMATALTMAPLGMGVALYAVPYVTLEGSFSAIIDWVLVAAFLFGITFFIFAICNLLKNGRTHLVIAIIFLVFACFLITGMISSEADVVNWESIRNLYGF